MNDQEADNRPVSVLNLPSAIQQRLVENDFLTIGVIQRVKTPAVLARQAKLNLSEATLVFVHIETLSFVPTPIDELGVPCSRFMDPSQAPHLFTFIRGLDEKFGRGLPVGEVVQLCGVPGTGKTTLCHQLAATVQIPTELGGLGGTAVYIDTEGSFSAPRLRSMATHMLTHLQARLTTHTTQRATPNSQLADRMGAALARVTPDTVCDGVRVVRALDLAELIAVLHVLPGMLHAAPGVRVVLIDSLAAHFRHDMTSVPRDRLMVLTELADTLSTIAYRFGVSIIITNHTTTRYTESAGQRAAYLAPALGDGIVAVPAATVMMTRDNTSTERSLKVLSRFAIDRRPVAVTIKEEGIRDAG